jgi:hypothetical protein
MELNSKEKRMPSKIKQSQFPRTLRKLEHDFERYPDSIMEYKREAMARGVIKKSGIQVPRFIIVRNALSHGGVFLDVKALSGRSLPNGDYHGFEYPDHLKFEVSGKARATDEPLTSTGQIIDNGEGYHHSAAVESGRLLLPAALEAKPLAIDHQIARLLQSHIQ